MSKADRGEPRGNKPELGWWPVGSSSKTGPFNQDLRGRKGLGDHGPQSSPINQNGIPHAIFPCEVLADVSSYSWAWLFLSSGLWVSGSPLLELSSFVVLTLSRKEVRFF